MGIPKVLTVSAVSNTPHYGLVQHTTKHADSQPVTTVHAERQLWPNLTTDLVLASPRLCARSEQQRACVWLSTELQRFSAGVYRGTVLLCCYASLCVLEQCNHLRWQEMHVCSP